MRRSTVLGLLALLIVVGAYSAFWWIAAGKIEDGATAWRDTARSQNIDASWQTMRVVGYPFAFRLELGGTTLKTIASVPAAELQAPLLKASIRPWNFHAVQLEAPDGIALALGPPGVPFARLAAEQGSGAAALDGNGRTTIWISLHQAKGSAAVDVSARSADAWVILPGQPPATHQDPGYAAALLLRDVAMPVTAPGFKNTIDELSFGATLMGAFPPGPLAQAAARWRDDGGTLELDHLQLRWGDVQVSGSGTLALGSDLQPVATLSGGIVGFDPLLNALVAAGRLKASDARVARLGLAMLATPRTDGRPEISTKFRIQDGEMFLGPARLGKAPRIDW